jgi:hypothetical protein
VRPTLTADGGASQSNRAPSPIELGCSDTDSACVLPNALQSDQPLRQIGSRTLEAGVRGSFGEGLRWNVSADRGVDIDDLLFISDGRAACLVGGSALDPRGQLSKARVLLYGLLGGAVAPPASMA